MQLDRKCLLLIDKMEILEANNVAIMTEKSLAEKSFLEMKKQYHALQEEYNLKTATWEEKEKTQNEKMQASLSVSQHELCLRILGMMRNAEC